MPRCFANASACLSVSAFSPSLRKFNIFPEYAAFSLESVFGSKGFMPPWFLANASACLSESVVRPGRSNPPWCFANASAASSERVARPGSKSLPWCFDNASAASSESVVRPGSESLPSRCANIVACSAVSVLISLRSSGSGCANTTPEIIATSKAITYRITSPSCG